MLERYGVTKCTIIASFVSQPHFLSKKWKLSRGRQSKPFDVMRVPFKGSAAGAQTIAFLSTARQLWRGLARQFSFLCRVRDSSREITAVHEQCHSITCYGSFDAAWAPQQTQASIHSRMHACPNKPHHCPGMSSGTHHVLKLRDLGRPFVHAEPTLCCLVRNSSRSRRQSVESTLCAINAYYGPTCICLGGIQSA